MMEMQPEGSKKRKVTRVGAFRFLVGGVVCLVLMLTWSLFFTGDLRALEVISGSMEPTIQIGDRLIVWDIEKDAPQRGDIVVLESPDDEGPELVKRLVGLPGDIIEARKGMFYLNGVPSPPPGSAGNFHPGVRDFKYTLKDGEYYVLGDNRSRSHDSLEFGPVDRSLIHGKVVYRYSPQGRMGKVD